MTFFRDFLVSLGAPMMVLPIAATTPTAWCQGTLAIVFVAIWVTVVPSLAKSGNPPASNTRGAHARSTMTWVKVKIQISLVF